MNLANQTGFFSSAEVWLMNHTSYPVWQEIKSQVQYQTWRQVGELVRNRINSQFYGNQRNDRYYQ